MKINKNNSKQNPLILKGKCFKQFLDLLKPLPYMQRVYYAYDCIKCGERFVKSLSRNDLTKKERRSPERFYCCKFCLEKLTNKKLYGNENYRNSDKLKETNRKLYGNNSSLHGKNQKKLEKIFKDKYGVDNPWKSNKVKNKIKETNLKKYGCKNPMQNTEINNKAVNTKIDKYGSLTINPGKYIFNEEIFDSSWELAFWIYHKDKHHKIKHEPKYFKYYKNRKYFVDFKVGNKYYEIKGAQYLVYKNDKIIDMKNPYNKDNFLAHRKYLCIKKHNITIIDNFKIKRYLKYIHETYDENYLEQFKK